jgi:hypothetical protein
MMAVVKSPPPAVTRLHPSLTGRIEEVNRFLDRALAKDRADRPADAAAFFDELGRALYGDQVPAGAVVQAPLDGVSSQSIELRLGEARSGEPRAARGDATEVNPPDDDRKTIPFVTAYDTAKQQAMGSGTDSQKVIVDSGSDIPIFVAGQGRLASGWFPRPDRDSDPRRASDSQRSTLPRRAAAVAATPSRRSWPRLLGLVVLVAAVAAIAFCLGRYAR